jgi:site-specific recombinase XerD
VYLRQFTTWCHARSLALFAVRRADIEGFARDLEARGRARATVTRRLCTIAGFYKYAVEEDLLDHSPAAHVRRPRVDYESHAVALDRNELGALLVAAGLGPPGEHALISPLALNGLRVSEATGADIEQLGLERGHRTLTITRKGGKVVTIPIAPRTARAIDLAVGERTGGPVFLAADGRRLDRHGAGRVVRKTARRAGITKAVTPHTLRHASRPLWMPGCRCAMSRRPPRMRIHGPRCAMTGPAAAWTGTRPTSLPPTSQAPPGNGLSDRKLRRAATAAGRSCLQPRQSYHYAVVTHCDLSANANRRSARVLACDRDQSGLGRSGCSALGAYW